MKKTQVAVACRDASGAPDIVFVSLNVDQNSIESGAHYDQAKALVEQQGYTNADLAFDENDPGWAKLIKPTTATSSKPELQGLADDAFEAYEFGDGVTVASHGGWQLEDQGDLYKVVCVHYPEDKPDDDSHRLTFHVRFEIDNGNAVVSEAYALDQKTGNEVGSMPVATPSVLQQLCERTGTSPNDWESFDGPETGVGIERWYQHTDGTQAYTCDDQGSVSIEVQD